MKHIFLFLVFSIFSCSIFSQNPQRHFVKQTIQDNVIEISTNDGYYLIKFLSDKIVETNFIPSDEIYNPKSHAVILQNAIKPILTENEEALDIATPGICVSVYKNPFQISYNYKNKSILSEKLGYTKRDTLKVLNFNIGSDDVLYGGGTRVLGMNRRGNKLTLYNKAHYGYETHSELMNFTMPLFFSSKIFAVHFDNAPIGFLDLDSEKNNTINYETISGRMTYQVIADDSWSSLISDFTQLTGRQPMPPRWVFGNFASRFGYHSQAETEKTVALFQKENIPLDAVVIDIYWFGKGIFDTMGNLEFFKDSFPEPQKMMQNFKDKGVKTILVTEPFILTTSNKWEESVKENILVKDKLGNPKTWIFYFGNTSLIDIYNPKAAKWFWNIYKNYTEMGVSGWWGDLGEPEVHPFDALHYNATANEVHNIYGHDWAKLIYDGYKKDFPNTRPFILMRSGAVGSQRYGMIPWTGDVSRSWGGFQAQPELALQMGMQGMGYIHSDLGGFGGDNPDNELYYRWLQYGVFQPIYRPHAQEAIPSEPVYRESWVKDLVKKAIELRYQMLPYNYSLAFENNQTGIPFMRPLFYEEPNNEMLLTYTDAFLWGNNILVAPIMKSNEFTKEVYFPKGNTWFDFYSNDTFEGGKKAIVQTVQDHIPTFVRGGSFVPLVEVFQSTDQFNLSNFDVHYYYDSKTIKSAYEMYNDDGKTPEAFEKTLFEMIEFKSDIKKNQLMIEIKPDFGVKFTSYNKQITLVIHKLNKKPKKLKINGKNVKFEWEDTYKTEFKFPIILKEDDLKIVFKF